MIEWRKNMKYFDAEGFGSICPENWEEICDYLNDKLESEVEEDTDEISEQEIIEEIWEKYCNGYYTDAPEAIFDE